MPTSPALDDVIPEARLSDTRRAIEIGLAGKSPDKIERLAGGAAGPAQVYKIIASGQAYLLRLDRAPDAFRDPARQYACQNIAAAAGVAPALLYADPQTRIALSEFVEASPGPRPANLETLVTSVKRLHAAPLFPALMPYFNAMDLLLKNFAAAEIVPVVILQPALDGYARIARVYPRDAAISSHNDLNPSNVLFAKGQVMIVDWESAFAADRYVDLAAMLNFFAADGVEENLILETYFGRQPNEVESARVFLMRQVNRLFYASLLLGSVKREKPDLSLSSADFLVPRFSEMRNQMATLATFEGRLRFGCVFLNEAASEMRSAAFEAALANLQR